MVAPVVCTHAQAAIMTHHGEVMRELNEAHWMNMDVHYLVAQGQPGQGRAGQGKGTRQLV